MENIKKLQDKHNKLYIKLKDSFKHEWQLKTLNELLEMEIELESLCNQ